MPYQVAEMLLGLGCIFLCSLLFRARLVPRLLAMWGAIGYAFLMTGAVAEIFGIHIGLVFSIPGGLFELTLGVWLIVRGFRPPAYGDRVETVRTVDRSPSLVHAAAEGETR